MCVTIIVFTHVFISGYKLFLVLCNTATIIFMDNIFPRNFNCYVYNVCHSVCVEVRKQLSRGTSFFLPRVPETELGKPDMHVKCWNSPVSSNPVL